MTIAYKKYIEIAVVALIAIYIVKHYLPDLATSLEL